MLPVDADVRSVFAEAVEVFVGFGCELVEAVPDTPDPARLWNVIALAEGYSSEGALLADWRDRMTPGTAEIIEAGRYPGWAVHRRAARPGPLANRRCPAAARPPFQFHRAYNAVPLYDAGLTGRGRTVGRQRPAAWARPDRAHHLFLVFAVSAMHDGWLSRCVHAAVSSD